MSVTKILALLALALAVGSLFITAYPLLPIAVLLLAVIELLRG